MKSILYAGAAVIAAMSVSATANAATLIPIDFQGSNPLTSPFGAGQIEAGEFTHTFDFTLSTDGLATSYAGSVALLAAGVPGDLNFSSVSLNGVLFTPVSTGFYEFYTLPATALMAGLNSIVVKGYSYGASSYSGTLNVAPVPEPATWAMMIAGLGIAGAALRRRASRVALSFS